MDSLRVTLIILGILLLAGIYLGDRLKRRKPRQERHWNDIDLDDDLSQSAGSFSACEEPLSGDWDEKEATLSARRHEPLAEEQLDELKGLGGAMDLIDELVEAPASSAAPTARLDESVIVLTVMAGEGRRFTGPWLLKVLQEVGLEHGEMGIFHYHLAGRERPLFSVANILEPGSFDLGEIVTLETPGIAVFMRLPAVVAGELALQTLLQKSRQMAAQLSGTLCDEQRRPLGEEKIAELEQLAGRYTAS